MPEADPAVSILANRKRGYSLECAGYTDPIESTPWLWPSNAATCVRPTTAKLKPWRGLNLEIHTGECFGLLGPNGAGKTTTSKFSKACSNPTSGEVSILGHSWRENEREMREWLGHFAAGDTALGKAFGARNHRTVCQFLPGAAVVR